MREGRSREYLKTTRRHGKAQIPMEKLLRSRIGQHWDKIYSEFSAEFDKGTEAGRKFFRNLEWEVETKCWKGADTGTIYTSKGVEAFGFYVHPMSGCLEFKATTPKPKKIKPLTRIPLSANQEYQKMDGIWYYLEWTTEASYYGNTETIIMGVKRQLNSHELKKLNIHNEGIDEQKRLKEERKKKEREAYKW